MTDPRAGNALLERLDPARTALVVVDVQEKLAPAVGDVALASVVRAASLLVEAARVTGAHVLATEQYPRGLGPTVPTVAALLGTAGVVPVEKIAFSALGEPAFLRALRSKSVRDVVLVGMEAHICVFQTARDLRALGYGVHIPFDGVASRRTDHRDAGLRLCEATGAIVTTAETVAFDWLRRAGTDAFKAVSKLVRLSWSRLS
jgi:nicotinamidase-related amidase